MHDTHAHSAESLWCAMMVHMSETIVVVDTNIIVGSPRLRSPGWTSLIDHAKEWGLRFAVPEVVQLETVNVVTRHWDKQRAAIRDLRVGEFGLSQTQADMIAAIAERIDGYGGELADRFREVGAEVVAFTTPDVLEISRRASERRAPYVKGGPENDPKGGATKDGFRDTVIWLTVLQIAERYPGCDVWFVSDNHRDFGSRGDDDDACPYPLRRELVGDLEDAGVANRVRYVRSLERLEQHLASEFASVPEADRLSLNEQIDQESLSGALAPFLDGRELSPKSAGLPLATAAARLSSFELLPESFRLLDAARRASDTWTTQFVVSVNAVVDVFDRTGNLDTITKPLRVEGRLTLTAEHAIDSIAVSSVSALPGDRMRGVWRLADPPTPELQRRLSEAVAVSFDQELMKRIRETAGASFNPELTKQIREAAQSSFDQELMKQMRQAAEGSFDPELMMQMRQAAATVTPEISAHINRYFDDQRGH